MKKKLLSTMPALCMTLGTAICPYSADVLYAAERGSL